MSGNIFTFAAHDTLDWYAVHLSNPHIPFAEVDGKTLTLSFDYRSDDFSDTTGDHHYIYINATASSVANGSGRTKYRQISTSTFDGVYVPTIEWQRGFITFDLSEELFNAGSGECNYFFIQFYNHTLNSYQLRHVKLEKGNTATDWTPAPEDMASSADSVEFISGTQTAATGSWTGVTRDSSLYTGKTIAYKLPYAGSGNASLQLKDSSGNNVGGNIAVYSMTTRVTTHYPAGSVIQMTYDGTYWRTAGWYNSNNYDRNLHNNYVKAAADVVSGQLVCGTSAGYKPIAASATFDMSYPILWASGA